MNYIDILPQIRNNIFFVRLVMSDYSAADELAIRITARRNDGYYETKIAKYPEEYEGNTEEVLIPFFGMSRSLIAQIVSVRVNGTEIRPAYSKLEGLEVSVRYDDSLTRMRWEEDMNNIHLDFEVIGSYNPKTLRVADQSEWGILADRPAIIEIKRPGSEDIYTYYLGKNQLNVFNSKTLGVNPGAPANDFVDIPDGIYDITIKGSPSSYSANRKYLKTDSMRLNIDKVWARAGILCEDEDDEIIEKIKEVEFVLTVAESSMRLGNFDTVQQLMDKAQHLIDIINDCKYCGC